MDSFLRHKEEDCRTILKDPKKQTEDGMKLPSLYESQNYFLHDFERNYEIKISYEIQECTKSHKG